MNDTWVTLQGWVGSEVDRREAAGVPVASFRVGTTPRHLRGGEWVDGATSWFTVNAWRTLARNVADSVHKGEPVVVHGRLHTEVWEREGKPASVTQVVEASFVGHDLNRGVTGFSRAVRRDRADSGGSTEPAEPSEPTGSAESAEPAGSDESGADEPTPPPVPRQRRSPEAAA